MRPFFPEYKVFAEGAGASFVTVLPDTDNFQINFDDLEKKLGAKTRAVIVNSPNNRRRRADKEYRFASLRRVVGVLSKDREYRLSYIGRAVQRACV